MEETWSFDSIKLAAVAFIDSSILTIRRNRLPFERDLCRCDNMFHYWVIKLDGSFRKTGTWENVPHFREIGRGNS